MGAPARGLQLVLRLVRKPRCETCQDVGDVPVPIRLPTGQRSFRLAPCPECDADYEENPK